MLKENHKSKWAATEHMYLAIWANAILLQNNLGVQQEMMKSQCPPLELMRLFRPSEEVRGSQGLERKQPSANAFALQALNSIITAIKHASKVVAKCLDQQV